MAKSAASVAEKTAAPTPTDETKSTAVALAKSTAVGAPTELEAMFEEDAGRGVATNATDIGIPFIYILQTLSPQVKKRDAKYVEGAEEGMIINNLSNELYSGEHGIFFIPCFFKSAMVEWKPRESGGGWVREYAWDDAIKNMVKFPDPDKPNKAVLPNGNVLVDTRYYYGIHIKADGAPEFAVIGFSSTGLKASREWQRQFTTVRTASGAQVPSYGKVYRLTASLQTKGPNSWFVFKPTPERWVNKTELEAARLLASQCEKGLVRASQPDENLAGSGGAAPEEEVL